MYFGKITDLLFELFLRFFDGMFVELLIELINDMIFKLFLVVQYILLVGERVEFLDCFLLDLLVSQYEGCRFD